MNAAEIHARLAGRWPQVLEGLGIDAAYLRKKKQGPCPACGGRDRFSFDDRKGRGDFICRGCGAGDGFELVMRVLRCDFATARRRVLETAGIREHDRDGPAPIAAKPTRTEPALARPPRRVLELLETSCALEALPDAMDYLGSRGLLPLPARHGLSAHASAEYYEDGRRVGRYSAILAPVRDIDGELVTVHVTYLKDGRKLVDRSPRKMLSPLEGHRGCAVKLMPADGDGMGIAEGLETALAAARIHEVPTWSALNATLLAKFEPPNATKRLIVFADRDVAGLEAAARLLERLQGHVTLEIRAPTAPAKDWNDVLSAHGDSTLMRGLQ